ncbi:ABC-type sugar transport system, ATPase component [Sphaerochaeta pleomorpha str. Grapes]|uniref:ABC-type sugar transport system, ATPase component n=1 Tax=Sphaerochaeta pleomorpha (strain ATCC BAA-1885 / DSM 22778 / Grapes) TaxID=158190 RepID=G8QXI3_SPHPG|nr:sugar ABC transporter ATP-binding protein [Sphaerochaeta pleomorpha]AEV29546.1 ABC-type sugar transport system, ATPase component [Sphaerochaeta pleomorpha str. Grapes]
MNNGTHTDDYILELSGITKRFPGVLALNNVDMKVKKGEVHVIVGENGAGKSTLMKVINGIYSADSGSIIFDGKPYKATSPTQARALGISMIFQELNFVPQLTVAENIYLGREPMIGKSLFVDNKKLNANARNYIKEQNLPFDAEDLMGSLSVSQAQIIEIIKAISCNAKLVIMDEPTSAITEKEVSFLFEKIALLKEKGVTIIYISHKMDEIFKIADTISIFRDGAHIDCRPTIEFNINNVIEKMVGRELSSGFPQKKCNIGKERFRVENFSDAKRFQNISFTLNEGEILGISGLMGAGRTEVVRAIIGLDSKCEGKIFLENRELKIKSVIDSIQYGIAMVSEDRRCYGIIPMRSVRENIILVGLKHYFHTQWIDRAKENAIVGEYIKKLEIKTSNQEVAISTLSGGNQQKAILAKWLISNPNVLILDEPTRGIDVGAKYEIYKLMCQLCENGVSIIMISSELPELLGMSDRILVMAEGKITGEFNRDNATQVEIMKKATGGR